jgi:hypothetical protein
VRGPAHTHASGASHKSITKASLRACPLAVLARASGVGGEKNIKRHECVSVSDSVRKMDSMQRRDREFISTDARSDSTGYFGLFWGYLKVVENVAVRLIFSATFIHHRME